MVSPAHTVKVDPAQRIAVISDMHIGDGSRAEPFQNKDVELRRFLATVSDEFDALVIAGDGFDLAQGWSIRRIRRAHAALFDDLIELSRSLPVYYLQGNHDGSAETLGAELPFIYSRRLMVGEGIVIEHGNASDPKNLPGDDGAFWGARVHAHIEKVIGSPVRIPMRKHYRWSTRLGHWLFFRYGTHMRHRASVYRVVGLDERARRCVAFLDYWGRGEWGDIHGLLEPARQRLRDTSIETLIWGHAHQAGLLEFDGGTYVNTGSWTYDDTSYVVLDHGRASVHDWRNSATIDDGEYRGVLGPQGDMSFFDWWERYYLGWFRYDVAAMERDAHGL